MGGLSIDQRNFVQTLADLSYGTGKGEGTAGGKGNMGLLYDSEGKMHVIKCNTHFSQAESAQKAVLAGKNKELLGASNNLRAEMLKIAKSLGMDNDAIRRVMGENEGGKSLLTRKAVASFVSELKKTVDESNREIREYGGDESEIDHSLDNIWKADRAKKSAWNMSFASVKASTEKGHNATVFSAEVAAARNARDFLDGVIEKGVRGLGPLRQKFAGAVKDALASDNPKPISANLVNLAKNLNAKFDAVGLGWMFDRDQKAANEQIKTDFANRFKSIGIGNEALVNAMAEKCVANVKSQLEVKAADMAEKGEPTLEKFIDDIARGLSSGVFFATVKTEVGRDAVKEALGDALKAFGDDIGDEIAKNIWDRMSRDSGVLDKLDALLATGSPTFSDIAKGVLSQLESPFQTDGGIPIASIKSALADQLAGKSKMDGDVLAVKIWKGGLSTAFADNFKAMATTGQPSFKKLALDFVHNDIGRFDQNTPDALFDDLECRLTLGTLSEENKSLIRGNFKFIQQVMHHKDDIIAGINEAFKEACEKAPADKKLDYETFMWRGHGQWGEAEAEVEFMDLLKARSGIEDVQFHVGRTKTSEIISILNRFARFPELYAKAKEKGQLEGLLVVLEEGGCAQARLGPLEMFETHLEEQAVTSPVKHDPDETPKDAILKEVRNAVEELRAEKKFDDGTPVPFRAVMDKMRDYVNGRMFAGVMWNKHQVYANLSEDELTKCGIECSSVDTDRFIAIRRGSHLGDWDEDEGAVIEG